MAFDRESRGRRKPEDDVRRRVDDIEGVLFDRLETDSRLQSGVPADHRVTDLDFIQMTGLTRPLTNGAIPGTGGRDSRTAEPDDILSFFERGVADVDASMAPPSLDDVDEGVNVIRGKREGLSEHWEDSFAARDNRAASRGRDAAEGGDYAPTVLEPSAIIDLKDVLAELREDRDIPAVSDHPGESVSAPIEPTADETTTVSFEYEYEPTEDRAEETRIPVEAAEVENVDAELPESWAGVVDTDIPERIEDVTPADEGRGAEILGPTLVVRPEWLVTSEPPAPETPAPDAVEETIESRESSDVEEAAQIEEPGISSELTTDYLLEIARHVDILESLSEENLTPAADVSVSPDTGESLKDEAFATNKDLIPEDAAIFDESAISDDTGISAELSADYLAEIARYVDTLESAKDNLAAVANEPTVESVMPSVDVSPGEIQVPEAIEEEMPAEKQPGASLAEIDLSAQAEWVEAAESIPAFELPAKEVVRGGAEGGFEELPVSGELATDETEIVTDEHAEPSTPVEDVVSDASAFPAEVTVDQLTELARYVDAADLLEVEWESRAEEQKEELVEPVLDTGGTETEIPEEVIDAMSLPVAGESVFEETPVEEVMAFAETDEKAVGTREEPTVISEAETPEPLVSEPDIFEPEAFEPAVPEAGVPEPVVSETEVFEPETCEPAVPEAEVPEPVVSETEVFEPPVFEAAVPDTATSEAVAVEFAVETTAPEVVEFSESRSEETTEALSDLWRDKSAPCEEYEEAGPVREEVFESASTSIEPLEPAAFVDEACERLPEPIAEVGEEATSVLEMVEAETPPPSMPADSEWLDVGESSAALESLVEGMEESIAEAPLAVSANEETFGAPLFEEASVADGAVSADHADDSALSRIETKSHPDDEVAVAAYEYHNENIEPEEIAAVSVSDTEPAALSDLPFRSQERQSDAEMVAAGAVCGEREAISAHVLPPLTMAEAEKLLEELDSQPREEALPNASAAPQGELRTAVDDGSRRDAATPPIPQQKETDESVYREPIPPRARRRSRRSRSRLRRRLVRWAIRISFAAIIVVGLAAGYERLQQWRSTPEELLAGAEKQARAGQYVDASRMFAAFARSHPDHAARAEAEFQAGYCLQLAPSGGFDEEQARLAEALAYYERFVQRNPAHAKVARATVLMGQLNYRLRRFEKAIDLLRDPSLRLRDPDSTLPVLRTLARAYTELGDYGSAESALLQAAALSGNYSSDVDYDALGDLFKLRADRAQTPEERAQFERSAIEQWTNACQTPGIDPANKAKILAKRDALASQANEPGPKPSDPAAQHGTASPGETLGQPSPSISSPAGSAPANAGASPVPEAGVATNTAPAPKTETVGNGMLDPNVEGQFLGGGAKPSNPLEKTAGSTAQ